MAALVGIGLACPFMLAAAAVASDVRVRPDFGASAIADLAGSTDTMQAWRSYALAGLMPNYSWAYDEAVVVHAPSLFDRSSVRVVEPTVRFARFNGDDSSLQVAFARAKVADSPAFLPVNDSGLLPELSPTLQRYVLAPSLAQRWGDTGTFSLTAILAYQRFAGLGLGMESLQDGVSAPYPIRANDASFGTGVRFGWNTALSDRISWQIGYQSRVNMDAFNNYRGVFSEPGNFDIPATTDFGVKFAVTPQLRVDVGVERVMYSQITAFTSAALPTRFLALLGSSNSPEFAWQNLSVYSIGGSWHDATTGDWSLHYSTRQQPLPTSPLLQQALEPDLSSYNLEFGYSRPISSNSILRLAATYAPTQFVLGAPTSYTVRDTNGGNQIEFDALWTIYF